MKARISVAVAFTALGLFGATPVLASVYADASFGGVVSSHETGNSEASARSSLADTQGLPYDCRCGGFSASSASIADGGALRGQLEGGGAYAYTGSAGSGFSDVLHFMVAGATDTTLTTVNLILSGTMLYGASGNGLVGATMAVDAAIGGAGIDTMSYASTLNGNLFAFNPMMDVSGSKAFEKVFTLQFYGSEATVNVDISQQLSLLVPGYASGSLNALSRLSIEAPSTVSYSGLGENALRGAAFPTAVPEPATWVMAILGFGLVGAAIRRRRGRQGQPTALA